jgi:hypothetical protein
MPNIQGGPEVPFPLRIIEDVMCRDCPFPKQGFDGVQIDALEQWQNDVLKQVQQALRHKGVSAELGHATDLIGRKLRVLRHGEAGDMMEVANRVTLHVDENDVIETITTG